MKILFWFCVGKIFDVFHIHYYGYRATTVLGGKIVQIRFCQICSKMKIKSVHPGTMEEFMAFAQTLALDSLKSRGPEKQEESSDRGYL